MEIQYMQTLETNNMLYEEWSKNKPMTISEIEGLELKYNSSSPFPKAFREYLFLAGKGSGVAVVWEDWDMLQEDLEEFFEIYEYSIGRPVFPFDMRDGGSVFSFFYLDEDKEDPDCYLLLSSDYLKNDDKPIIKSANGYTFSGLINEAIRRVKNDIRF